MLKLPLYYINQNYVSTQKYYESIKSCVLFTSHKYIVRVILKTTKKRKRRRIDLICVQYSNACKLDSNSDGQDF